MAFNNDSFRRLIAEQTRIQGLIDQAMGGPTMRAIIEGTDPLRQLRSQIPSQLGIEASLSSSTQAALDNALDSGPVAVSKLIQQSFDDQQALIRRAQEVLRPQHTHYGLTQSVLSPHLGAAEQLRSDTSALNSIRSIQASIEEAMQFSNGINAQSLLGMSAISLLDRIDPLRRHLHDLEQILEQFDLSYEEEAGESESPLTRTNLLVGLDILRTAIFDLGYKILIVWLMLNSTSTIDQEQLDRIEQSVIQLAEHHKAVSEHRDQIAEGHETLASITTTDVYLRTGPSEANDNIMLLEEHTPFVVTRQENSWSAGIATLPDGKQIPGWIHSDYLVTEPNDSE